MHLHGFQLRTAVPSPTLHIIILDPGSRHLFYQKVLGPFLGGRGQIVFFLKKKRKHSMGALVTFSVYILSIQ